MESIAILVELLFKWGPLAIVAIGLLRLISHRGDGKKHITTKVVIFLSTLFFLFVFISYYNARQLRIPKIVGDYKLLSYKCEDCINCIVRLKNDETYTLLKNGVEIDKGSWDFEENMLIVFLSVENGIQGHALASTKIIPYIKNEGCQKYWKKQNLFQEVDGVVVKIDSAVAIYGVYAFEYRDSKTNHVLRYEPKYIGHPWLNKKLFPGDRVYKAKNSLSFKIIKPNGEVANILEEK